MKKKKALSIFLPFFFIQHISTKKKKSATAGEIIHSHVFISHLYYSTTAFQRTTHHRGELGRRPERIPTAAPSSGQLTRQRADKEGWRFLPDLSIRGSLREWEILPIVANRLPPTGRQSDQAAMEGMSGYPKNSYYPSSLPIPPQSQGNPSFCLATISYGTNTVPHR